MYNEHLTMIVFLTDTVTYNKFFVKQACFAG